MKDENETKEQLIAELVELRQRVADSEASESEHERVEKELRESEEKYRSIVEQSDDGIVVIDEHGAIIEWNRGQERITGLKRTEVIGQPLWDVLVQLSPEEQKIPEVYEQDKNRILDFLRTGQASWLNQFLGREIQCPDGTRRIIQSLVLPINTNKGIIAGGISRDITERRRAGEMLAKQTTELSKANEMLEEKNRLLEAFNKIGQLTLSSLDLEQVLDNLAEHIVKAGIFPSLMIALVDGQKQNVEVVRNLTYHVVDDTVVPSFRATDQRVIGTRYDLNDSNITAEVAREGEIKAIEGWDDRFDRKFDRPEYRKGRVSYFIPVKRGDQVLAVLATRSKIEEKEKMLHQIEVMRPLLDEVAIAIAHGKLYGALRESEEKFRSLFERSNDAIIIHDLKGQTLDVNTRTCEVLGYDADQLRSMTISMILAEANLVMSEKAFQETWEKGHVQFESRFKRANGTVLDVEISPHIIDEKKGIVQVIVRDITERKRMEETINRRLKFEETVACISSRFISYSNIDGSINNSLADIGHLSGASRTYVFTFRENGAMMNNTHEWCGEGVSPQIDNLQDLPSEMFPWWMAKLRKGEVIHVKNVSKMPAEAKAEKEILESQDVRSLLVLPLNVEGKLAGFIGFDNIMEVGKWRDEDLAILRVFSEILGNALERRQVETALRESEEKFRSLAEQSPSMIFINKKGRIIYTNKKCEEVMGHKKEEFYSPDFDFFALIAPESIDRVKASFSRHMKGEEVVPYECTIITKRGRRIEAIVATKSIKYEGESAILGIVTDITERKQVEEEKEKMQAQLLQAQRMEAIGTLAGGMAHEIKNLMTIIQGYTDLAITEVDESTPLHEDLKQTRSAAMRAVDLTSQLLLFSRKQPMKPKSLNINRIVDNLLKMLGRFIGEDITINTKLESELWTVSADAGGIEQVIANLAANARDAMPEGGKLTIKTENVCLDEDYCKDIPESRSGKFVCLSIEDTGVGMDKEIIRHIFEPFFSTKEAGRGTGLGLSAVYGIAKQHEGWINVYSEPGQGSTFKVYLPAVSARPKDEAKETISLQQFQGRGERILLVEDEKGVREFAMDMLSGNGYVVFEAASAEEALNIFEREKGNFKLVFSDIVLPGKNGFQLVNELLSQKPKLLVLLSSGYADQKVRWSMIRERGFRFLEKPYSLPDLLRAIREVMEQG